MPRDAELRFTMRDQAQIADRALALIVLVRRAELEDGFNRARDEASREAPRVELEELYRWLRRAGLDAPQTPRETELVAADLGSWTPATFIAAAWRAEALGALLWTLSLIDRLPPYDRPFPTKHVLARAGSLQPAAEFRARARLRDAEEIADARATARGWLDGLGANSPPSAGDDGSRVFGKPLGELSDAEFWRVAMIARERRLALDWACGAAVDWDVRNPLDPRR